MGWSRKRGKRCGACRCGPRDEEVCEDDAEDKIRHPDLNRVREADVGRHERIIRQERHHSTQDRKRQTQRQRRVAPGANQTDGGQGGCALARLGL